MEYSIIHRDQHGVVLTFCYHFYYIIFVITPTFSPSTWRLWTNAAAAVCHWNTMSNILAKTPLPLIQSRIWFNGMGASLLDATLHETETEPLDPPFSLHWVGHRWNLPAQCACSIPPESLPPSHLPSHFSDDVLICCHPHHPASMFFPNCLTSLSHI